MRCLRIESASTAKPLMNRINFFDPEEKDVGSDLGEFPLALDQLLTEYSGRVPTGEIVAALAVAQHRVISEGFAMLDEEDDSGDE